MSTERGYLPTGLDAAVLRHANGLMSDDDGKTNPEYDRAIVELTAALLGISTDERERVEMLIRGLTDVKDQ